MAVAAEKQADGHAREGEDQKQQRRARAAARAQQAGEGTRGALRGHQRRADAVHQPAAQQIAHGDGAELQRVARRVDARLHGQRYLQPQKRVHVGVHRRYAHPAQQRAQAPDGRRAPQRQQQVFRTHGKEQRIVDDAHAAAGRAAQRGEHAAQQRGNAGAGVDPAQGRLAPAGAGDRHGRQRGVVHGGDEVDGGKKENQVQNALLFAQKAQPGARRLQRRFPAPQRTPRGNPHKTGQRNDGHKAGAQVKKDDHLQPGEGVEHGGQHRREHRGQGVAQRLHAGGALIALAGHEQAHRHVGGGLLQRIHQAVEGVEDVEMGDVQPPRAGKQQHAKGGQRREKVAQEHRALFVPAVAQRAGEDANHHIGRVGTDGQKRRGHGGAGLSIGPEHQREAGHGAAQRRKCLR